jgi:hypothetical protein
MLDLSWANRCVAAGKVGLEVLIVCLIVGDGCRVAKPGRAFALEWLRRNLA